MLFHQAVGFRLQLFKIGAGLLQHLLFDAAGSFLVFENPLVLLLLGARAAAFLAQTLQLQPGHG